ncbi:MAG: MoaD/ThiS family protein [Planctomycetota bacterium]|nr:MoaD/ThiS family protein [Planctomycetota bacterium]
MNLNILLFASLKDAAGSSTIEIQMTEGDRVADLIEAIRRDHPQLSKRLDHVRVALGDEFVTSETVITEGAELALIPPVSGG